MRTPQQEDTGSEVGARGGDSAPGLRWTSGVKNGVTLGLHGLALWFRTSASSYGNSTFIRDGSKVA